MINKADDNVIDVEENDDNVIDVEENMEEELLASKRDIRELRESMERNHDVVVGLIKEVKKQIQDNYSVKKTSPRVELEPKIKLDGLSEITGGYFNRTDKSLV